MGEVYLALDSQLDRPIALKILPAQIARDHGKTLIFVRGTVRSDVVMLRDFR
jgi:hypothetical protein